MELGRTHRRQRQSRDTREREQRRERRHRRDMGWEDTRPQRSPQEERLWRSSLCRELSVQVERLSCRLVFFPSLQPRVSLTRVQVPKLQIGANQSPAETKPDQSQSLKEVTTPGPESGLRSDPGLKLDPEHTVILLDSDWRTFYLDPEPNLIINLNRSRPKIEPKTGAETRPKTGPETKLEPRPETRLRTGPNTRPQTKSGFRQRTTPGLESRTKPGSKSELKPDFIIQMDQSRPGHRLEPGLRLEPGFRIEPHFGTDSRPEVFMELDQTRLPKPRPGIHPDFIIHMDPSGALDPGLDPGLEQDFIIHMDPRGLSDPGLDPGVNSGRDPGLNIGLEVLGPNNTETNQNCSEFVENFAKVKIEVSDFCAEESSDMMASFGFGDFRIENMSSNLKSHQPKDFTAIKCKAVELEDYERLKVEWTECEATDEIFKVERSNTEVIVESAEDFKMDQDFKVDWSDDRSYENDFKVDWSDDRSYENDFKVDWRGDEDNEEVFKVEYGEEDTLNVDQRLRGEDKECGHSLKVDWRDHSGYENSFKVDHRDRSGDKESEDDFKWEDFCAVCSNGGELLCCDRCPKVYHLNCHVPLLLSVPEGHWVCSLCRLDSDLDPDQSQNLHQDSERFSRVLVPYTLSSQDQRRCEKLTLLLLTHTLSLPFHRPVSPQFRHYYQIVRHPVDLSLIRRKLQTTPLAAWTTPLIQAIPPPSLQTLPSATPVPQTLPSAMLPPLSSLPASQIPLSASSPAVQTPPSAALRYLSPEQFVDDVLLMFHNCATFNYPDSEVAEAGLKLKAFFLLKLKEVFPERTFPSASQSTANRKCHLKWSQRRRNKLYKYFLK